MKQAIDSIVRGILTLGLCAATGWLWWRGGGISAVPRELLIATSIAAGQYLPFPGSVGRK